jgi:hypothetical protein
MKTALVIIKRPIVVLPPLARLCIECYNDLHVDWKCLIDDGKHLFRHPSIRIDFLVRRKIDNLIQLSKDLAKKEGNCERVIIVNFGDWCTLDYIDKIKTNTVGLSHLYDCYGNNLKEKEFLQKESFICISVYNSTDISTDKDLNVFISKIATQDDINRYHLDIK